ncbi:MAG TPA: metal-dependent hydrolase [Trueperaceae bacterium]|nr:metal-dependent hydrolase [Trueperaceae bacterium]
MRLRFLGHSGMQLVAAGTEVVIDPYISGHPNTPVTLDELAPDLVVITHAHGDHWGDTEAIAGASGATVVSSAEIAGYAADRGLKSHAMNIGGAHTFGACRVKFTPAWHSSSFPDGSYGGMPMGVILELAGQRIYHAGDTALFEDMKLIGRGGLDLALLPIGDNYTMGPEDALAAVELLQPKRVVPMHYDTFDLLSQDAVAFASAVRSRTSAECEVLRPGETIDL